MVGFTPVSRIENSDLDDLIKKAKEKTFFPINFLAPDGSKIAIRLLAVHKSTKKGFSRVSLDIDWEGVQGVDDAFKKFVEKIKMSDENDYHEIVCGPHIMRIDIKKGSERSALAIMLDFLKDCGGLYFQKMELK